LKKTNPSSNSKDNSSGPELYLYLTTRGRRTGKPRQIEIWFTEREGRFYVIAEYATSRWVENLRADPHVQVRVGDKQFPARARFVAPESEHEVQLGRGDRGGVGSRSRDVNTKTGAA